MRQAAPSPFDNPPPIPPEEMDAYQLAVDSYYDRGTGEPITQEEAERQLRNQAVEDLGRFTVMNSVAHQEASIPDRDNFVLNSDPDRYATSHNKLLMDALDKPFPTEIYTPPELTHKEVRDFNGILDAIEARRTRPVFDGNHRVEIKEEVKDRAGNTVRNERGEPVLKVTGLRQRTTKEINEAMTGAFVRQMAEKIAENPRYGRLVETRLAQWQSHVTDAEKNHDSTTADHDKAKDNVATRESAARRVGKEREDFPLDPKYDPDSIAFKKSLLEARKISDPAERQKAVDKLNEQAKRYRRESKDPRYTSWFNNAKWLPSNIRDINPTTAKRNNLSKDRFVVDLHNRDVNAAPTHVAVATLAAAKTGTATGYSKHNLREAEHRHDFLQGIYDQARQANHIADKDTLESILPNPDVVNVYTRQDLRKMWKTYREDGTYTAEAEHKVFSDLEKARQALENIDWYLYNNDPASEGYSDIQLLRNDFLKTYHHGRYLREMMRAGQAARNGENGRFMPTFEEDRGIALNDGTTTILYPDFSYSTEDERGNRTRRMYDMSPWQPVNFAPEQAPEDLSQENNRQLVRQFNETMEDWFVTQDAGLGSKARNMARELRERNEEAFNNKPDHPQYDQRATLYAYWEKFLATGTPDADAAEATLWRDGSVVTHDTYYSHPHGARVAGMWRLHASKRKQLLQPDTLA